MTTAIVLALPLPGADPRDRLAGVSLAIRAVLTLQKEGARRIILVVSSERDGAELGAEVRGDRRVRVPLEVVRGSSEGAGLRAACEQLTGTFVIVMHHVLLDPSLYRELMAAVPDGAVAVALCEGDELLGPLLATPDLLAALVAAGSLESAVRALLAGGKAKRLSVGAAWHARADTPEGRRRAFDELFEACRKPVDGLVARRLNRHISIFISKRLVGTPLTPNMMSVVTFLLAIAAALFAARGGYVPTLIGAFLFQWNSILDGVDGELARVRFQHSKAGQWLDTVSDDLSNVIFYAGLAIGARSLPFGRELMACGFVTIPLAVVTAAIYYVEMFQVGSGDLYAIDWGFDKVVPPGIGGKLLIFWRNVLKKDFMILFFLVLAICGVLPYILPIVLAAQFCVLIAAILRKVRRRAAARARVAT